MARTRFVYASTLKGLSDRVSALLGDGEYGLENQTWDRALVDAIVCDALVFVSTLNEKDFTSVEKVKLEGVNGCYEAPDTCTKILSVVKFSEIQTFAAAKGKTRRVEVIIPADEGDYTQIKASQQYPAFNCSGCTNLTDAINSLAYAMDTTSDTSFIVSPTPPAGSEVYAYLRCVKAYTTEDLEKELPASMRKHFSLVISWAMYLLLSLETDDAESLNAAALHRDAFLSASSITVRQVEAEYRRAREERLGGA